MTRPFDLTGPLPAPGITVLEASAGTGKTYTIAGLAARYVAEGFRLEELLLVTFTVLATGELRERVRERLVGVELALRTADPGDDPVAQVLLADGGDVELRRRRLERALADFDAATIQTTHGFCLEMLSGLGVDGDLEPDHVFAEDVSDLVREVVDDLYVRRFHKHGDPPFDRRQAGAIVTTAAVDNPAAPLEPRGAAESSTPAMRRRLAEVARSELDARKRRMALMTYDDLLTRLDGALDRGAAVDRLRRRFSVVLVDEFQDTDPIQWSVLEKAFGGGETRLVLIGDPKQAIYAFRGADVYAYLRAAQAASAEHTLQVNWRSDQGLIDAYDALFGNARLGHEGIVYREVEAAPPNRVERYAGAPDPAPLRVRIVDRHRAGTTRGGNASKGPAMELIADDLAADVVGLLEARTQVCGRDIEPADVAVLVRYHAEAAQVRDALAHAGVPAVINGAGSVFSTPAATDWLRLLEALERPSSEQRAHGAALTPFVGWDAARVAQASEDDWEEVHRRLHHWARVLRLRGVASLTEAITLTERLPERVLAVADGERRLTDLRHVGQLLHTAATGESMGPTALAGWLRRRVAEAGRDAGDEERSRRLESDAAAVQVLTIHRSKGLEFPVVYFPFLWHQRRPRKGEPVVYHEGDARTLDVGLEGGAYDAHFERHLEEERGEDLRLLYVALTRAKHQAVIWWAGTYDGTNSALNRLLFARRSDGSVPAFGAGTPSDGFARDRFRELAAAAPGCISVAAADPPPALPRWTAVAPSSAPLATRAFDRGLDWAWRRTSYSDITAGVHDARVASEPEEPLLTDEPEDIEVAGAEPADPVPLAEMAVGVRVGTAVHRLLEEADFTAPDLEAHLREGLPAELADAAPGLAVALRTPFLGDLALSGLGRADRLDELGFELPLAGGDTPDGELTLDAIAAVLRAHGEPVPGYAGRLADATLKSSVRGYLTGSIDLVVRHEGRFAVVDYKTNWLGADRTDYAPDRLAEEMVGYHYALQALLYTAALHRYLRWRLAGYDPGRHLGGVRYLFLRGMTGEPGTGVFAWDPPPALVVALSDALDGGAA